MRVSDACHQIKLNVVAFLLQLKAIMLPEINIQFEFQRGIRWSNSIVGEDFVAHLGF